jgi:Putative addiction module component
MSKPRLDIEKMSPEERLDLMEQLWESLRKDPASVPDYGTAGRTGSPAGRYGS